MYALAWKRTMPSPLGKVDFSSPPRAMKKTEEVTPQYVFAHRHRKDDTLYRTSPAPFGGTLPKGEGFFTH